MTKTAELVFKEVLDLPYSERLQIADQLAENLAMDTPDEILKSQIDEVRLRIAEVDSGKVKLMDGQTVLKSVRDRIGQ